MNHPKEAIEAVARALWAEAEGSAVSYPGDTVIWGETQSYRDAANAHLADYDARATALLDAIAPALRDQAFRAGMMEAALICKMTGKKIEGHTKDHPVNWAHNCSVFINMNADEMDADDIAAAIRKGD